MGSFTNKKCECNRSWIWKIQVPSICIYIYIYIYITCSNLKTITERTYERIKYKTWRNIYALPSSARDMMFLVIKESHGEKYKSAQPWGLPCVYPSSVLESVGKGQAEPSAKYLLMPKKKSSKRYRSHFWIIGDAGAMTIKIWQWGYNVNFSTVLTQQVMCYLQSHY